MDETGLRIMQLGAQGYCCSQIMIKLTLEDMGEDNVPLVRAMAGLCEGSSTGDLCGVASGAACVLALYGAKGSDDEQPLACYPVMLSQFMEWFKGSASEWGGIRCEDITLASGGRNEEVCGGIMQQARMTLLGILDAHGIDPSQGRDDEPAW